MHEDARRVVRGVWLQREQPTYYRDVECICIQHTYVLYINMHFYTLVEGYTNTPGRFSAITYIWY